MMELFTICRLWIKHHLSNHPNVAMPSCFEISKMENILQNVTSNFFSQNHNSDILPQVKTLLVSS